MKVCLGSAAFWMKKNLDLITLLLATTLTWLSRLEPSKSIILKDALIPQPLFHTEFIIDFPDGNLSGALKKFAKNEVILIYVYSHWDEECVSHKATIEHLAEYIHYKIPVVAINCWKNTTDCFKTIKPNRFPKLYAFVSNYLFIEYKRSIELIDMFQFINSLFYPFHFPKTNNELDNLLRLNDVSLIFCLNSQSSSFSRKVKMFHQISSLYKGKDINDPSVGFIAISETDETFKVFREMNNFSGDEMILYGSSGVEDKYIGKLLSSDVMNFLRKNTLSPLINKYSPNGVKSLRSQDLLMRGALVIYIHNEKNQFQWHNIKTRYNFFSIALQTKKCSSVKDYKFSISNLLNFKKEILIRDYLKNYKESLACHQYSQRRVLSNFTFDIISLLSSLKLNHSSHVTDMNNLLCLNEDYVVDPFVTTAHLLNLEWVCRKHSLLTDYSWDHTNVNQDSIMNEESLLFEELPLASCTGNYNRTIQFAEVDSGKYPKLLENLGLTVENENAPRVIVVDWKNEIIHHMKSEVNLSSISNLIEQLTINNLTTNMKVDENTLPKSIPMLFHPINVLALEKALEDPTTDTIVYYYTPWCSYCSSLSNLFIMLARYFADYSMIHFTSINTFNNDLPFKFQSERVPSLIIYPRGKKSESVVFRITSENLSLSSLIRFVLEHSGDTSLNLNAPSFNLDNEPNVICDKRCLESAKEVIVQIQQRFNNALRTINSKMKYFHLQINETCSLSEFDIFQMRVASAYDWKDYHSKYFRKKYQSYLISVISRFWRKRTFLRGKLKRLADTSKGIDIVLADVSFGRSARSLAADILQVVT